MTLSMTITREVKPQEIVDLVWGTGALGMSWWHGASLRRRNNKQLILVSEDDLREDDVFALMVDDPDEAEGSGRTLRKVLSFQKIADAASMAAVQGYVTDPDAIYNELGFCDALEADCILQLAVFGRIVYG